MEYKKGQFLRNKKTQKICKMYWDTKFINEDIWELWVPNEGEWCWFCNNGDVENGISPRIGKYGLMSYTLEYYDLCEPWNKNLPFDME